MRSTWETAYAHYLDACKLKWFYEPRAFRTSLGFYFPDFFVQVDAELDKWEFHEVKGRLLAKAYQKMEEFKKLYPDEKLVLLQKAELQALGVLDRSSKTTHRRTR